MDQQPALDQLSMVASEQFRKIQSTAQQALAQCMELGLHVLPIQQYVSHPKSLLFVLTSRDLHRTWLSICLH